MTIVFPDHINLDGSARQKLEAMGVKMYDDTPSDERIRDAEIITANFIDITPAIIDAAPKLKCIISPAVGYDWIDHAYAASKGIQILNCPTQNAAAVAEHAIGLIFSVARRITEADLSLRKGEWRQQEFMGIELNHRKLGLVGYGKIGKLVEQKAAALGMQVTHVNSSSSAEALDTLLQTSDVVCLCLPLNDFTKDIMDKRRLGLLKKDTIFINVARGALVDQAVLLELLKNGSIRGAGLDVFMNESFTGDVPQSIVELASLRNVVATPHMAYNTEETMQRLGQELLDNITAFLAGEPINVVNK